MDIKTSKNAVVLVKRILTHGNTSAVAEIKPQKSYLYDPKNAKRVPLERSTPEKEGISSAVIAGLLSDINNDSTLNMHSMLIVKNKRVIFETGFGDFSSDIPQSTYSACKSITSLAIGMLIDDGVLSLNEKVVDIFKDRANLVTQLFRRELTVKNLLRMTSGVVFNEAGSVTETDWAKCFLESAQKSEPGKKFDYNSMNSYMLSAIVVQKTGKGLSEFLDERLFLPLGIYEYYWERCPKGIEKGGWGLYIRPEDMAKIGIMMVDGGVYNGKRIISERYVKEATSRKMSAPTVYGDFDYGYQMWSARDRNAFLFNGMYGQNMLAFPDTGLIIVTNAGNNEMFQQSNYFKYVMSRMGDDFPKGAVPVSRTGRKALSAEVKRAHYPESSVFSVPSRMFLQNIAGHLPDICSTVDGKAYTVHGDEGDGIGIMPLFLQVFQNNYTSGISGVSFSVAGNTLSVIISENDAALDFKTDFMTPSDTVYEYGGEKYRVTVSAAATTDEENTPVLVFRLSFTETCSTRFIKFFLRRDGNIRCELSEKPSEGFVKVFAEGYTEDEKYAVLNNLLSRLEGGYADYKLARLFNPVLDFFEKPSR